MTKKKTTDHALSQAEIQLLERLRAHPQMMERLQSILEITGNTEGPLKTADEVEELLLQEMRRLGNTSMHHWASQAEERVSQEVQAQDPTLRSRKKKR
jgi:hypothetical protein